MADEKKLNTHLLYVLHLENEAVANTDWFGNPDKKYVCALLPNFFILYFGQKPPTRHITYDDVKMEFTTLGKGYEAWRTGAEEAMNLSRKIAQVLDNVANSLGYDKVTFVQRYCDAMWTGKKISLAGNGPHLSIIMVALDFYPMETDDIKKDFLAQPQSSAVHPAFNTLTIQHPGEQGQEAEAEKGVAKLMLLCL